jgi:hypothetical protein
MEKIHVEIPLETIAPAPSAPRNAAYLTALKAALDLPLC